MKTEKERISDAIEMAVMYGGIDGAHHKNWVIDQMVRILAGDDYERIVLERWFDGPIGFRVMLKEITVDDINAPSPVKTIEKGGNISPGPLPYMYSAFRRRMMRLALREL